MGIKIIKKRNFENFTFIDDGMNLSQHQDKKEEGSKKDKSEPDYKLRESHKVTKLKTSRLTGGHGMQGHSPVYE